VGHDVQLRVLLAQVLTECSIQQLVGAGSAVPRGGVRELPDEGRMLALEGELKEDAHEPDQATLMECGNTAVSNTLLEKRQDPAAVPEHSLRQERALSPFPIVCDLQKAQCFWSILAGQWDNPHGVELLFSSAGMTSRRATANSRSAPDSFITGCRLVRSVELEYRRAKRATRFPLRLPLIVPPSILRAYVIVRVRPALQAGPEAAAWANAPKETSAAVVTTSTTLSPILGLHVRLLPVALLGIIPRGAEVQYANSRDLAGHRGCGRARIAPHVQTPERVVHRRPGTSPAITTATL
jgi:hypothetical protein